MRFRLVLVMMSLCAAIVARTSLEPKRVHEERRLQASVRDTDEEHARQERKAADSERAKQALLARSW